MRLEVEGLFGSDLKIGLTPREDRTFEKHTQGTMPEYRFCVVTEALSRKARLVVFRFDVEKQRWIDDHAGQIIVPGIGLVQAAIVSLD